MRLKTIKQIGDRISKKYSVYYLDGVIAERLQLNNGSRCIEVRTELVSYEGGDEFIDTVQKKLGYSGENLGGCVYRFFKEI